MIEFDDALPIIVVLVLALLCGFAIYRENQWRERCREAGGQPITLQTEGRDICAAPPTEIKVKR